MSGASRLERWTDVIADTEATATEYRERNWTAIAVHPGDVNPIIDESRVDVLLPGSTFDDVRSEMADATVDTVRVYAADEAHVRYRLVVAEDSDRSLAVCVPTFISRSDLVQLRGAAGDGPITVRLRPLDDRDVVDITVSDPTLFFAPDESH